MKRVILFLALVLMLSLTACNSQASFCDSVTDVPIFECDFLVVFFNATGGAEWKDQHG